MENEIWKVIPGFSNYEASNLGFVRSLDYKRTGKKKIIKPAIDRGYLKSMFKNDLGKYKTKRIHVLIALTFLGNRPDGLVTNHKDGNKKNNSINNLEYITHSENCKHSFDIGLQKPKRGELNGMSKLTQKDVDFLREEKRKNGRFWGRNEYAKQYRISAKHLQKIVNSNYSW